MRKSAQSNSSNGELDAAPEGAFHGGVNVTLECAHQIKDSLKLHKNVTKKTHSMLHLMVHLKEGIEGSSEGTPKVVP